MADIEVNNKSRKPTSKKVFSLDDFKKDVGAEDSPDKPFEWIKCSDAVAEVLGVPGIAKGYVNLCRGFSNTGKSTMLCEAVVSAQKMGILPIIIDTENNLGEKRLELMGFDFEKEHILINNDYLLKKFGKLQNKDRNSAAIEDLAKCINFFLDQQEDGNLPRDILFAVDSIGTLDCIKSIDAAEKDSTNNNLWNAGAFASAFKSLMNYRIPISKKQNKEFTNTFVGVQKVWFDSMVGGSGCLRHSGGEALYSAARLIFHFGGTKSHSTSKIVAISNKIEVTFGIKVSASLAKNHINDTLGGISFAGEDIISTPHGFISATKESIDEYKRKNLKYFREILGGGDIDMDDIETKFVKIKNDEKIDFGDNN